MSYRLDPLFPVARNNWGWILTWGILFIILGVIAIGLSVLTTLITVILLGCLILIGGVVVLVDAFKSWWGHWSGFLLHALVGILYIIVGWMLIANPVMASISLTLLLGIFYLALGIFRIIYALSLRYPHWKLNIFNGIIGLILGLLILSNWPASSLVIIGLFVGIDLLISGWIYVMIALTAKNA